MIRFRTRRNNPRELTVEACTLHVCDHATYHRGQLNSMIRRAGGQPSPVMMYTYAMNRGMGRELTD